MALDPKPGTAKAIEKGCICAVMDNHYGKGRYGDGEKHGWFITGGCMIHDTTGIKPSAGVVDVGDCE